MDLTVNLSDSNTRWGGFFMWWLRWGKAVTGTDLTAKGSLRWSFKLIGQFAQWLVDKKETRNDTHTFRRQVFFMIVWLVRGASLHFYWPWVQAFPFCALEKYRLLHSDVPGAGRKPGEGVSQQQVGCSISGKMERQHRTGGGGAWVSRGIWQFHPLFKWLLFKIAQMLTVFSWGFKFSPPLPACK